MQTMGAVFFTTLALIENGGSAAALIAPAANPRFILAALFLALGASVAGYSLFNYAVSHRSFSRRNGRCAHRHMGSAEISARKRI